VPYALGALLIVVSFGRAPALAAGTLDIAYAKDHLTGRVVGVPRAQVLSEIGTKAGVEVIGTVVDPDDVVTLEFGGDTLAREMERLLGRQSYSLLYADGGQLRAIHLHGRIAEAAAAPVTPAPAPTMPATAALPNDLMQAVRDHAPIVLGEPLRSIVGTPSASIGALYDVAANNPSAEARAAALDALARAVESDPRLRAMLARGGPSLQGFVEATGGYSTDRIVDGLTAMPASRGAASPTP
jgi:hypothetical protein